MTRLATSALGLILLNPIGCSGTTSVNNGGADAGVGGATASGGTSGVVRCDIFASNPCPPNQICKQTMFPVMPPGGFGGNVTSAYLGECVAAGQGGSSSTGGVASTGGSAGSSSTVAKGGAKSATGGSAPIIYSIMPPATGGRAATGGTTAISYPVMAPTSQNSESQSTALPAIGPAPRESDSWWQKAEAALRRA